MKKSVLIILGILLVSSCVMITVRDRELDVEIGSENEKNEEDEVSTLYDRRGILWA